MSELNPDFTYLSFGAGTQSSALLVMTNRGLRGCPRADAIIFADTGDEPQWVYDQLEWGQRFSDIPVEVVQKGVLSQDVIDRHTGKKKRFACIPSFTTTTTGESGPLRRHCTREYKIEPIQKRVRELMGYRPRQRIKHIALALIGISLDEASRAGLSRQRWIVNDYPLINAGMNREACVQLLAEHGAPPMKKSSCRFCPYHSDRYWLELRRDYPIEWLKAVEFDRAIRDMSMSGAKSPVYLHRSLKPLDEVSFRHENQLELFDEECSGYCGV